MNPDVPRWIGIFDIGTGLADGQFYYGFGGHTSALVEIASSFQSALKESPGVR